MKLEDVIKRLEEIKSKEGNIEVVVQFRDDGGFYSGSDEELILKTQKRTLSYNKFGEINNKADTVCVL